MESNFSIRPDVAEIVDAATRACEVKTISPGELVGVVTPAGGDFHLVDLAEKLAKHSDTPQRATGVHTAATVAAFADIVERHNSEDLTIWVHPTNGKIVAVLNDHAAGQLARWGDHRVRLELQQTEAWKRWKSKDGLELEQQAFAEQIEDGLAEIARPAGADLLEMAQTMHGTTSAAWKAGARLHDGSVRFSYVEDAQAKAGAEGQIEVPQDFDLVLSPFVGESPRHLLARLRWRNRNGHLMLGYKLDNPEMFVQAVLQDIADRLAEKFPGVVFLGEPRA